MQMPRRFQETVAKIWSGKEGWFAGIFMASSIAIACWQTVILLDWELASHLGMTALPKSLHHSWNWLTAIVGGGCILLCLMSLFSLHASERKRYVAAARAREVESSLHLRDKQLTGIIESIDQVLWTFDFPSWKINYVSPAVERVYGYRAAAFYDDPNLWLKCVHAADRQKVVALSRKMIGRGQKIFQYRIVRPDGEVRWIRYEAHYIQGAKPGSGRIDSVGNDVTSQHLLEESLRRRNRTLRALLDCERVISGPGDEQFFLQGVCDVAVAAGYRMAWAGLLSRDGSGRIEPAGMAGEYQGYLACIESVLDGAERDLTTLGGALRKRKPVVDNCLGDDSGPTPWREEAKLRGFRAEIALPLLHGDEAIGILNVYAREKNAFDTEEIELLMGLALRVTASIQSHRHRSARQAAEAALNLRERAIEASTNAIVITSATAPDYPVEYINPAFERITGYTADEIIGRSCRLLQASDRDQQGIEAIRMALRDKCESKVILRNYRKDGTLFWNDMHIAPVKDADGEVRHFVAVQYDITAMKQYESELRHQANHDSLTGLPNRALLQERLNQEIAYAAHHVRSVWLVFVDIDRFKFVNDTLGHKAGDLLLKTIARRLQSAVRETDMVARLGGDEFVLILTERRGMDLAAGTMRRILDAVAQPLTIERCELLPTCSMGAAIYPVDSTDDKTLMTQADIAMYRAKEMGRNNCQFYAAEMETPTLDKLHLEGELRHALEREQFMLEYQPQVDLRSGQVVGMEALIRWHHPELGLVPPVDFIGLAEETGLIVAIGNWVLRTACDQNKAWQRAGLVHLRVAVNLSARQFAQQDLVQTVAATLAASGLEARYLEIELTESLVMTDVERAIDILRGLKKIGIKLSIDDFGTGYSSLSYLKRFPIDVLKIDRSFVRDIAVDSDDAAIVASIISLSHNLKLQVIAEGVETQQQLAFLRKHGCDQMQGFYFSKPLSVGRFAQLLRTGKSLSPTCDSVAA